MYGIEDASELPEVVTSALEDSSVAKDDISSAPTAQQWCIDHLSYVCHFNTQDQKSTSVLATLPHCVGLAPQLKSYGEKHKLAETTEVRHAPDVLDQILELLPTLTDPEELVNKNWKLFATKSELTSLDNVAKIDVWDDFVTESYEQLKSSRSCAGAFLSE
ncbi:hypothetical protein BGZ82_010499, partial [Podila clonocystis]